MKIAVGINLKAPSKTHRKPPVTANKGEMSMVNSLLVSNPSGSQLSFLFYIWAVGVVVEDYPAFGGSPPGYRGRQRRSPNEFLVVLGLPDYRYFDP